MNVLEHVFSLLLVPIQKNIIHFSDLTAKSYMTDGTIKIIIKNFILTLKNVTLASKLKKIIY